MARGEGRDEQRPLLPSDTRHFRSTSPQADEEFPSLSQDNETTTQSRPGLTAAARRQTKRFLVSKTGHYSVLALVSLDVSAIFADLIIQLITCEGRLKSSEGELASNVLGIVSLVFSCLFMLELMASVWAFGFSFFRSWFHCVDATVILAGFVIDVLLKGILEEIGSLVVVLRLWRVLKIIEELSAGAEEQMDVLHDRVEDLEKENTALRQRLRMFSER